MAYTLYFVLQASVSLKLGKSSASHWAYFQMLGRYSIGKKVCMLQGMYIHAYFTLQVPTLACSS